MLNAWGTLGMILVLATFVHLGFAYIIWAYASKETGMKKIIGQIISIVIIILSLVILFGISSNASKAKNMMRGGSCPMMKSGMPMNMTGPGMMHKEEAKKEGDMSKHVEKKEINKTGIEKGRKHHKK